MIESYASLGCLTPDPSEWLASEAGNFLDFIVSDDPLTA
jgi:hypothetical protein